MDTEHISNGDELNKLSRQEKIDEISSMGMDGDVGNDNYIAKYLNDKDSEVVASACFYLGHLGSRRYVNEMALLLDSADDNIVNLCLSGLSFVVEPRDSILLERLYSLLSHDYKLVRMGAVEVIGNIGNEQSVSVLKEIFDGSELAVKAQIIVALGRIGSSESLPFLLSYQKSVKEMDHSQPRLGGVRGSEPHPDVLDIIVANAINSIEKRR